MSEFANRVRASLWWIVPLLLALAVLAWETDFGRAIVKPPPAAEPIAPRPVVASLLPEYAIAGGTAARTDTVQRTLFNPTRRPAPVALADAAKPRMQRGQFTLTGTMIVGGKNTAFLRETAAGGKSRRVQQGETVNGMTVAEVRADRVSLALGDETEELVLRVATNPRPTTPPLPAGTPGAAPGTAPAPVAVPPARAAAAAGAAGAAEASLAERRRAARAAQAAMQAQTSTPDGNPIPAPAASTTAPAGTSTGSSAPAPPPGAAPDPRWQDVYRNYQNRTQVAPAK